MAGVINIITKKTDNKSKAVNGTIDYGSYQTLRSNLSLMGHKKKTDYQVNCSYLKTKGINETIDSTTSPHQTDRDGYNQLNLNGSFTYKPSDKTSFHPYIRFAKFNQEYDQDAFLDELDLSSRNDNLQYGFKNEFSFGKSLLTTLYNHNYNKRIYVDDSVLSQNGYSKYSKGNYTGREHFGDVYFVRPINNNLKYSAGADFRSSNTDQSFFYIDNYGEYNSKLGKDSIHQNQIGLYGSFNVNMKSGFNVELGGRWNHHSAYGNNFVYSINPSYFFHNQYKVFVNVSSAYKTPTLYQLYSEYGNKKLMPEIAYTYEGGFQAYSRNKKNNARITYYKREVKDIILFFTDPNTYASKYINQDKQKDDGVEIESTLTLAKKTTLKVFYAFVDGKITTMNNGNDTSYFNLIRRPKNTIGINASCGLINNLYFSVGANSIGNRTDIAYDANFNQAEVILKKYIICNFYAEYQLQKNKMKLFANVNNFTNTQFSEVYGFASMGRNASFGLRFNY
jgi:vitamin B12 transporter